jgi:hypothetical protein
MITDAQLVEKHLELKAHVAAENEAHDAKMKPFKDGMATIENALLERLNERGAENTKTDAGTAYKSTITNVKVIKRDTFLKFCIDNWSTVGADMLNVSAVKDPTKQFIDSGGIPDQIGIETSFFTRINIRKS